MTRIATGSGLLDAHPNSPLFWWRSGVAVLLLGLLASLVYPSISDGEWWIVEAFLIASGLLLLPELWRALNRSKEEVLADHLLVLVGAFLAYFVIGALFIPLSSSPAVEDTLAFYFVNASMAMRITAVNSIGFGLALISSALTRRYWRMGWARTALDFGRFVRPEWATVGFVLIGGVSSLYVTALDLGLYEDQLASGLLRLGEKVSYVAIMILAAYRGKGSFFALILAILFTAVLAFIGLLMFSKSAVLLPMMAIVAGLVWKLGVRRVVLPGIAALVLALTMIGTPVMNARNVGLGDRIDWRERLDFMSESLLRSSGTTPGDEYAVWSRFCYLPPQAAALDLYDAGLGGTDIGIAGWAFLPRFLFPEKPIMTVSGSDFYNKVSGLSGSSFGQGVFVDGYYNLGWWGVIIASIAVGFMLACTSALAAEIYRARILVWLPMALLGSYMAFRIDGFFLGDYWGPFVMFSIIVFGAMQFASSARVKVVVG